MSDLSLHRTANAPRQGVFDLRRVMAALDVWRSRQHLKTLNSRQLEDIGVTRKEANIEANRPIWDVPTHWMK